jgi:RimJ/RimL family protein N-acetyltransferase
VLIGHDKAVAQWVGQRLGIADFGLCTAIGIVQDDKLIAGAVFNNYRGANIEITFASSTPRWCSRKVMAGVFWYPFQQLGCHRVTAVVEQTDTHVRLFVHHIGFREEGTMRRAFRNGNNAVIYGMLREECRWLAKQNVEDRDLGAAAG